MTRRFRLAIALMLAAGIAGPFPRLASAQPGGHPFITSAHADFDLFRLRIVGQNFGTSPKVWLAETRLEVESATDTEINVLLGGPVDPGSYLITVARGRKDIDSKGEGHDKDDDEDDEGKGSARLLFSSFDVTIGAHGPQGEQGEQGIQGLQGNDGRDGVDGKDGTDGKDGASPFRLIGNNAVYTNGNIGAGTEGPSALLQAGPGQDFGQITTIGASQRPQDTVGLSVRSDFARPTFQFCASGPCNYIQMDRNSTDLWFGDFNNPSMIVEGRSQGGRVGIGTQAPERLLHIRHTDNNGVMMDRLNPAAFSGFQMHEGGAANERWFMGLAPGPSHLVLRNRAFRNVFTLEDNAPQNALYLNAIGNLGIGTANTTAKLQVGELGGFPNHFGNITTVGVFQEPGDTVGLSIRRGNGNPTQQFCSNDCNYIEMRAQTNDLWLGSAPNIGQPATMIVQRRDLGGNVGVGTLSPTAKLHVGELGGFPNHFGNITTFGVFQEPGDTVGLSIRRGNGNPIQQFCNFDCNYIEMDGATNLLFGTNGNSINPTMSVRRTVQGGGVGIHMPPQGGFALAVNGTVIAQQYTQFSSRRFKSDIETLGGALGLVERMRGVTYTSKSTGKAEVGLIAEEVNDVLPQVVAVTNGEVQGIEYSRLVAVLIEAVKEQQAQIAALRQEVSALVAAAAQR